MNAEPRPPLAWSAAGLPPDLVALLRTLGAEYPLPEVAAGAATVRFVAEPDRAGYLAELRDGVAMVRYGRLAAAARAVGSLLAGLVREGLPLAEQTPFETLGILLDCGHNGTLTTAHLRRWLRRLALLGFDQVMVYTEAGYLLPEEPCFGYQRGAWSLAEFQELDAFAAGLGMELVGSIQALGHLEQVLKWPPYAAIRDTEHTLLVGAEGTAALVEKMVAWWSQACRSRRLHVGLDETYDLGRGRSLDLHGYRPGLDLYVEHLRLVAETCDRHGLRPLVWSDVLFRLASPGGGHYDPSSQLSEAIRERLPRTVDLVYWDYYSPSPDHYLARLASHRALGYEPVMASGVWSWPTPWHDWRRTAANAGACVTACRQAGVRELLFTLWSDDGAFWDVDSSLAGVALAADLSWGDEGVDEPALAARFAAICGSDLAAHRTASRLNEPLQTCSVLWDDPLLALYLRWVARESTAPLRAAADHYAQIARELEPHRGDTAAGDLGHARLVARCLAAKTALAADLFEAWSAGDRAALGALTAAATGLADLVDEVAASFRRRWLACCQPFGLEVLQIRFAGQAARYRELARRLTEWLDGEVPTIPELDASRQGAWLPARHHTYRGLASGARVF